MIRDCVIESTLESTLKITPESKCWSVATFAERHLFISMLDKNSLKIESICIYVWISPKVKGVFACSQITASSSRGQYCWTIFYLNSKGAFDHCQLVHKGRLGVLCDQVEGQAFDEDCIRMQVILCLKCRFNWIWHTEASIMLKLFGILLNS